jgi:uncharacterized protein (TIGR03437 family)
VNSIQERNSDDAFVVRINSTGSGLLYSTYLGGRVSEDALAIKVDDAGNAYVAGWTNSDDFPRANPFQNTYQPTVCGSPPLLFLCPDGFVAKLFSESHLFPGGMVSAASFFPNGAVAAGSIAAAFGADLASGVTGAAVIPLPGTLAGITLRMNDVVAPLYFVSGGQITVQVPWELEGQSQAQIVVSINDTPLAPITVPIAAAAPGIFTLNSQGTGQGAILIASSGELAAPAGSVPGRNSRPANRGEIVTIYCTGLGNVTNRPASGAAARSNPLSSTTFTPSVTIGGLPATPGFSGLTPDLVGLYQINVQVPTNAPTGNAVAVAISVNGAASNTVLMAIQ